MQSSVPNREVFERKISQVYDMIELGDYKKAQRQVNTLLEKGEKKMHIVEKLTYKMVKVYVLEKAGKRQESIQEAD